MLQGMTVNGDWRKFTVMLKAAGWQRVDQFDWRHPDGGKFYPWNMSYGTPAWRIWFDKGETPPSDSRPFEKIRTVKDD